MGPPTPPDDHLYARDDRCWVAYANGTAVLPNGTILVGTYDNFEDAVRSSHFPNLETLMLRFSLLHFSVLRFFSSDSHPPNAP
ncbi:Uncharacterized protein FWK35_00025288 [Aphis craccivora]|uniref:Uncharacterized protein n=1 Tax=Aphis craccivora TaxID=307492 RepID=A0A6G0XYX6_APHCR|nr:Uncharacterized protein FWK35_00025288 [Aphis craccivora]